MPYREKFEPAIKIFREVIDKLKPKMFTKELIALDSKLEKYEAQDLSFSNYCEYLIKLAKKRNLDISKYSNMQNFATVSELEGKVDFKKVDKERNDIIYTPNFT